MRALREFLVCCRCFASAALFHHPIRTMIFLLYLAANYVLQANWLAVRDFVLNNILFSCTALFYLIEKPIFSIITVPIRNTAIRFARAEHLVQNIKQASIDRMNFGAVYAIFKRIEKIFSGLERDLVNMIKYLPLLVISAKSTGDHFTNTYVAAMFFAINLASIYYIKFWTKFRKDAYNAEEDLTSQVLKLFQNLDRSKQNDDMMDFANKTIAKENSLYVRAILAKQYYRIALCIANVVMIFLAIRYGAYDAKGIISMGFFVFNWTQFSVSIISMSGMISGLDFKSHAKAKSHNSSNNIVIKDLSIEGIFDHVSLEIKDQEWVMISGANGAGKTFMCKLITQQIHNDCVSSPDEYIMITNYSSIFSYEKQNLAQNDMWKRFFAKKYNFLLETKFISAAQNAFLCIVSSVTHNPKLLVVDESLDLLEQDMLQDVLVFLKTVNMIFVVVSHRDDFARYFDRRLVIKNRQIEEL